MDLAVGEGSEDLVGGGEVELGEAMVKEEADLRRHGSDESFASKRIQPKQVGMTKIVLKWVNLFGGTLLHSSNTGLNVNTPCKFSNFPPS